MTAPTLPPPPSPDLRPRLRGWLHFWSFIVSVATGAALIALAASTVSARAALATSVYGATVVGLFGVSALYHRRAWTSAKARTWMKRLDHSMIFVFIAGTYTPFALLAMPPDTGRVVLIAVWIGALGGVTLKLAWPHAPRWVGVPFYIALGWVAVFVFPELLHHAGVAALVLLIAGGLLYTVGAVFYATRWPNHWPKVFGYHEFFHAATVLAAICHYVAIWFAMYS
ncbi:hemolysin III family protein [Solihabitans fulvus]|uniref:Hemolysin III family protein n=1 Tax=Solihabitans fulvus TaxID=1892852 RepID=A0A5B2XJZ0_9PSEU|nr:hemolysin III family protein [Solihabitans fulvus]KAA2263231.1 hemolysin III family protein [Solihabitans fulvus]